VRHALVLARSSDYYRYHLANHPAFRLVICGLHDSYLHLVAWETCTQPALQRAGNAPGD
jgi:hypothetical protein